MKYLAAIILCVFTAAVAIAALNDAKLILENADGTNRQQTLTDPGADRLMIWDDSENAFAYVDGAGIYLPIDGSVNMAGTLNMDAESITNAVINANLNTVSNIGASEIEAGIISGHSEELAPDIADLMLLNDGGVLKYVSLGDLISLQDDDLALAGGTMTGDIAMGTNTISGVAADVYGVGWNGSDEVATKNDIYDKIETISAFDSTTVDATTWSDGANASNIWTFDLSGATDPTLTFADDKITVGGDFEATGTSTFATLDITGALSVGSFKLNDTDSAFELELQSTSTLTADRILTIDAEDAASTLTVGASTTLSGGTHSGTNTGDQTAGGPLTVVTTAFGTNFANDAAHDTVQELMDVVDDLALGGAPADLNDITNVTLTTPAATHVLAFTGTGNASANRALADADIPNTITIDLATTATTANNLAADGVDTITEIAAALKSGADGTLVTGTSGLTGNLVMWDASGDAIASGVDSADPAFTTVDANSFTANPGSGIDAQAAGALDIGNTTATSIDYGSNGVTAHTFASDNADDVILDGSDSSIGGSAIAVAADQLSSFAAGGTISPDLIDAVGAVDQDYGSADILDHTFVSNGGTVIIDGADSTIDGSAIAVAADTLDVFAAGGTPLDKSTTLEIYTEKHAASHTISAAECYGGVHYVTAAATITLPAAADGMSVTILTVGAVAVSVDPNASDLIMLDGTALDDGDKVTNTSTSGDICVLTYYDTTGWFASTNTWTDGGP